jgi:hypothetical protein
MKQNLTLFLCFCIPLFCLAQNPLPREYEYDAAGNRTVRKVINLLPAPPKPPAPPEDSLLVALDTLPVTHAEFPITPSLPHSLTPFFVEKIAGMEMKIYPNPTTEKITFEIAGLDNWANNGMITGANGNSLLQLRLYSLSGQLLQTQTIRSVTTEISLSGLAKGVYILKVQMEGIEEEWKVIKN